MSLRSRLGMTQQGKSNKASVEIKSAQSEADYYAIKSKIHYNVIDHINLAVLSKSNDEAMALELENAIRKVISEQGLPLSEQENEQLVVEIKDEVLGLGPLEPLLADESISEIMCNRYDRVYVERGGRLQKIPVRFSNDSHLLKIIDKIVTTVGRRIDESSPLVDARLLDGSRVNAIIPPLAIDGPALTIRKFKKDPLKVDDLVRFGSISQEAARLMEGVVKARLNIIISGGTGSGKTTMLNVFSSFIPKNERIVTIEDSAELQLQQEHVVRLETRPPNIEGHGEITMRELVKNCLRMRPDRIVVGEVRSGEALDMMQAMSTGHDGSLTTLHSNTPRDCLGRLETLVAMGGLDISEKAIRRQIASAVHIIVQVARLSDGSRKVTSFTEVTGMEGSIITLQEIFKFEQTGVDENGKVIGQFGPTGIRPFYSQKLKAHGFDLDGEMFSTQQKRF